MEGFNVMENEFRKDTLYIKTFGGFSMTWNGKLLTGSIKTSESQFVYLMQLLLHNRKDGIERNRVEEILFEDRDILAISQQAAKSILEEDPLLVSEKYRGLRRRAEKIIAGGIVMN